MPRTARRRTLPGLVERRCQITLRLAARLRPELACFCQSGAASGTRTRNLLFTRQLLYQLSYCGRNFEFTHTANMECRRYMPKWQDAAEAVGVRTRVDTGSQATPCICRCRQKILFCAWQIGLSFTAGVEPAHHACVNMTFKVFPLDRHRLKDGIGWVSGTVFAAVAGQTAPLRMGRDEYH